MEKTIQGEAIHIHTLKPSINIDLGRHQLSSHFDKILKSVITQPPAPAPHDPSNETLINTAPRRQGRPRKEPTQQGHISHQHQGHTSQQQQQTQQQLESQQQPSPTTRPKAFTTTVSQPQRQSQRLLTRQQQQQQLQTAEMRSTDPPPAAP